MPRLVYRKPTYRKHISGQAVVTIHGVDHYLGRYGTAESRVKYRRLIAEGEVLGAISPTRHKANDITIMEVIAGYLRHAKCYFVKGGRETSEVHCIRSAARPLDLPPGFTPVSMLVQRLLKHTPWAGG